MKKINIKLAIVFPLLSFVFASCLKDKAVDEGRIGIKPNENQKIVEIAGPASGFFNLDLVGSARDTTVNLVVVRLASANVAETDIQVTLVQDNSMVTAYNTAHGTSYQVPATNLYQIPSTLTVTIPKGQREGYVTLKATPNNLFGALYAFGFRLASTSDPSITLSGNFGTQVVALTIRNKYDGIYTLKFSMDPGPIRIAAGSSTWRGPFTYPCDISMLTTGPNSTKLFNPAYNAGFHPLMTPGVSGFGSTEPQFVFDENDRLVGVSNLITGTRTFRLNPAVTTSRYDPATKTIYAAIIMDQTGFDPLPIYDTLIYKAARP